MHSGLQILIYIGNRHETQRFTIDVLKCQKQVWANNFQIKTLIIGSTHNLVNLILTISSTNLIFSHVGS